MEWEKELDKKFGDFYATGWGGEKCYCNTLLKQFISAQIAKAKQEGLNVRVSMLRQYLNERNSDKLITNEEIEEFLIL